MVKEVGFFSKLAEYNFVHPSSLLSYGGGIPCLVVVVKFLSNKIFKSILEVWNIPVSAFINVFNHVSYDFVKRTIALSIFWI